MPWRTRLAVLSRLLAVQGSWNYETMVGNGIGFSMEPALRALRRDHGEQAYAEALARQSRYFNAHPYLASIAVGALARAEVDELPPAQVERFRTALVGPLGSVGDRLVWAGWLPFSSLLALLAYGLGAGPLAVVLIFLLVYNVGHIGLRAWGLEVGWRHGLRVAPALAHPILRQGPQYLMRAVLFLAGAALPLVIARVLTAGPGRVPLGWNTLLAGTVATLIGAALVAALLLHLHGRLEGWRVTLAVLVLVILFAVMA